jgi:hypothetical protein
MVKKCKFEEFRLLGCGAMYILCEPTFRRKVSSPSSGYKNPRARNQHEQVATDYAVCSHLLMLVPRSLIFLP